MEELNQEKQEKLEKEFHQQVDRVTDKEVEKVIIEGKEKIDSLSGRIPKALEEIWKDIVDMWNMIVDYWEGNYTEVPWGTIAAIVVALLYFISPVDLIPDFIPIIGYIDDVFVINLALKLINEDIEAYRKWKNRAEATQDTVYPTEA